MKTGIYDQALQGIYNQLKRGDDKILVAIWDTKGGGYRVYLNMSTAAYLRLSSLRLIQEKPNSPPEHGHLVTLTPLGKEVITMTDLWWERET